MSKKELTLKARFGLLTLLLISLIIGLLAGGVLVGIFFNVSSRPKLLVAFSAFLATFIASVMGDEQETRLRNGTFGAIAGTSVGGLAALLVDDKSLLLVGIFGSSCGAILGWIVYLCLTFLAASEVGRRLFEYQFGGLKAVREKLDLDDKEKLHQALHVWSQNFSRVVAYEKMCLCNKPCHTETNYWIRVAIKNWLTTITDVLNLVFDSLAKKDEYRSRVSVIIFGQAEKEHEGKIETITKGVHWISYAGRLPSHKKKPFDEQSIAYQVMVGELPSPYLKTIEVRDHPAGGQDRAPKDQDENKKKGQRDSKDKAKEYYQSFYSFRLNNNAILSVDWPGEIEVDDPFIDIFKDLFYLDVAPAIGELLSHWNGKIEDEPELSKVLHKS
jgi:hypothetical protein